MKMQRRTLGFTLVELLVAITLLGLIAVALSGALRFGARVWDVGTERGAQSSRVEAAQNFLRRRIAEANTVFRHVSNILAKIGATNRTEAARYAGEQGLSS